jgi:hypothetical protein
MDSLQLPVKIVGEASGSFADAQHFWEIGNPPSACKQA